MSDKKVRAKKHLGQHFLKDETIAERIAETIAYGEEQTTVLEIGPGMGVLTKYLLDRPDLETWVCEIDKESVTYLETNYSEQLHNRIISADFLQLDLGNLFPTKFSLIGNYPYNISSQIFFKVLDFKDQIPFVSGMLQKEVAERITAKHGNKTYGILSVLLQAYYKTEYLFTVDEHVFDPPPKVKSAVIQLTRNDVVQLPCDEKLFKRLIKMGFNTRRKTLRNCYKSLDLPKEITDEETFNKRAEQLSVDDFITLTQVVEKAMKTTE